MLNEAFLRALLTADTDPLDAITILYNHDCTACGSTCKAVHSHEVEDTIVVTWDCPKCTLREDITYKEAA